MSTTDVKDAVREKYSQAALSGGPSEGSFMLRAVFGP
jgi:hypothetical protein